MYSSIKDFTNVNILTHGDKNLPIQALAPLTVSSDGGAGAVEHIVCRGSFFLQKYKL